MEKGPGCRIFLALIFAAIVGSFVFTGSQCGGFGPPQGEQQQASEVVATIAGEGVTAATIELAAEQQKQNIIQQMGSYPPDSEAMTVGNAIANAVTQRLLVELAKRNNIPMDEATIRATAGKNLDESIAKMRNDLITQKKLKPDASEAEFQKALKDNYGQDAAGMREQQATAIAGALADPNRKIDALSYNANMSLSARYEKELTPSDEALRKSFTTHKMKRVWLDATKNVGIDLTEKLDSIKAEIASGKLTFEQAMNKYSNDMPPKNKTVSESTFELDGTTLAVDPEFKPVQTMKPGDVSPIISSGDSGAGIYKLLEIAPNIPKDFDAKKEEYRKTYCQSRAAQKLQEELKKLKEEGGVKWSNPGFEVLYNWYALRYEPGVAPKGREARKKRLLELQTAAKAAMDAPSSSQRLAALAWFSITADLMRFGNDAEKKEWASDRIESIGAVLQFTDNVAVRLEMADLLVAKKDGKGASEQLLSAAYANQDYGPSGQAAFGDINAKVDQVKNKGLLDPKVAADIQKVQEDWKKQKIEQDTYEAEQKRKADEEQKKFKAEQEAEAAKAKAEADKAKKAEKPKPTGGTTGKK